MKVIDNEDIERLKEVFVTRKECQSQADTFDSKLNKDNVRLAVIENQLKLVLWVLMAVGGGIITMLIKMFFGG